MGRHMGYISGIHRRLCHLPDLPCQVGNIPCLNNIAGFSILNQFRQPAIIRYDCRSAQGLGLQDAVGAILIPFTGEAYTQGIGYDLL